jgi:phospholipid/cholesterol/gamma-HCH transport system substrate-binding protein
MAGERSLEVKVGLLVLVGVGLLGALVLVMGGISLGRYRAVLVDFANPGGLQSGAPVKIAGIRVGSVESMRFLGRGPSGRTRVRVSARVEERYVSELRDDATFYVTTQGVLGEQFLAIDPGGGAGPLDLAVAHEGISPPRIDLFVARAFDLLDDTVTSVRANRRQLGGIVDDLSGVLRRTNEVLARNDGRIDGILAGVDRAVRDADGLVLATRDRYVDGAQARRIVNRAESVLASLERDVPPLTRDARALTARLDRIAAGVGPAQIDDLQAALRDVRALTSRANTIAGDVQTVSARVRSGQGTVGALLMDEEIYDDLQELVRDLKHNPWKFFWRE